MRYLSFFFLFSIEYLDGKPQIPQNSSFSQPYDLQWFKLILWFELRRSEKARQHPILEAGWWDQAKLNSAISNDLLITPKFWDCGNGGVMVMEGRGFLLRWGFCLNSDGQPTLSAPTSYLNLRGQPGGKLSRRSEMDGMESHSLNYLQSDLLDSWWIVVISHYTEGQHPLLKEKKKE